MPKGVLVRRIERASLAWVLPAAPASRPGRARGRGGVPPRSRLLMVATSRPRPSVSLVAAPPARRGCTWPEGDLTTRRRVTALVRSRTVGRQRRDEARRASNDADAVRAGVGQPRAHEPAGGSGRIVSRDQEPCLPPRSSTSTSVWYIGVRTWPLRRICHTQQPGPAVNTREQRVRSRVFPAVWCKTVASACTVRLPLSPLLPARAPNGCVASYIFF